MHPDFESAAFASGIPDFYLWELCPDLLAGNLLIAAKRYSRFLKESGVASSHSAALEIFAKASNFPNWHTFHKVVQGLFDAFNPQVHWPRPEGGREPLLTLTHTLVFLVEASADCPPTFAEQAGLTNAAKQICKACDSPLEPVLDMIGRMNGADSWAKLLTRKPEESKEPLYGFHVYEDGSGRFTISSACSALIEQQDRLFQGYDSRTESEKHEFQKQLKSVLEARPDFLEGLLAKAEIMRYEPSLWAQQAKVYADAISQANALIPADFKGDIIWGQISNRFYHRLLYCSMTRHAVMGHIATALPLARRQLRLNKGDNLGVRIWLPLLLAATGENSAADKACKKLNPHGAYWDAALDLVCAVCHFANGRLLDAANSLYLSVFKFPPMRHIIVFNFDALRDSYQSEKSSRNVSPDPEALLDQFGAVAMKIEGLESTFEQWLLLPEVVKAELEMERVFFENWRTPNGSLKKWEAEFKAQAAALSKLAMDA